MDAKKVVATLQALARVDLDAIGAYEAAIKRCVPDVAEQLSSFRVDHVRHVQDLNSLLVERGGPAVEEAAHLKGTVLRTVTAATSMLGTEGALLAMLGNEELTHRSYGAALKAELPPDVRQLLERHLGDEARHLSYIKATLRSRVWERKHEVHP